MSERTDRKTGADLFVESEPDLKKWGQIYFNDTHRHGGLFELMPSHPLDQLETSRLEAT